MTTWSIKSVIKSVKNFKSLGVDIEFKDGKKLFITDTLLRQILENYAYEDGKCYYIGDALKDFIFTTRDSP